MWSVYLAKGVIACGPTIMPSGAAEHGARRFGSKDARTAACLEEVAAWLRAFSHAFLRHQKAESTRTAQARSCGLTVEQARIRQARDRARQSYRLGAHLEEEALAWAKWQPGWRNEHGMGP